MGLYLGTYHRVKLILSNLSCRFIIIRLVQLYYFKNYIVQRTYKL